MMIKMRPFDKMPYCELQNEYLKQLVIAGAIAFDEEDVLGTTNNTQQSKATIAPRTKNKIMQSKTVAALKLLERSDFKYDKLKDFLYPNGSNISKENLQRLLLGPKDAPGSLGGNGSKSSLRQHFEEIIDTLGIPGKDSEIRVCKELFKYEALNYEKRGQIESTAYWLQRQLGVEVCPYCNRMYTTTLSGKCRIRSDFDHFYPKSRYPYLAVSLFNLIPSCSMCNRKKGDIAELFNKESSEDISIIYPYDESFDEMHGQISFRMIPHNKEAIVGQSEEFTIELHPQKYSDKLEFAHTGGVLAKTNVKMRFEHSLKLSLANGEKDTAKKESKFWDRAKNSIDLLLIESFYNRHKGEIMALLRNHYQYNQDGIELIMKTLARGRIPNVAKQEIKLIARGMMYFAFLDQEEWGKSPLNKLKSDIIDQLDEIEGTHIDS